MSEDDRVRRLLKLAEGKRVIHIGCADVPFTADRISNGTLLHKRLIEQASEIIGIDVDEKGIRMLEEAFPGSVYFTPKNAPSYEEFAADVIIIGEVVEHLMDFISFGCFVKKISNQKTLIVVTTPNAYSIKGVIRALFGIEQQHPDHKCLFTPNTLDAMMREIGFILVNRSYYSNPPRRGVSFIQGSAANLVAMMFPRVSDGLFFLYRKEQ